MATPIAFFDYDLPKEFIAQAPSVPRDHSRLMILHRAQKTIEQRRFFEIVDYLQAGDVLVFNNTKVFKARLMLGEIEIFLLRERDGLWQALARPGRKLVVGGRIGPIGPMGPIRVVQKNDDGTVLLDFGLPKEEVLKLCEAHGEVPIPPYVEKTATAMENYQTVYAKTTGAVAAPTAGLHFTDGLLETIRQKGVQIEFVTLHVGLGTFLPVKTDTLEEHKMHAEYVEIDQGTADRINAAKQEGRRIIAVGTTVVRTLEAAVRLVAGRLVKIPSYSGDVNIFITPGFDFRVVDAIITNFHLPKSTLLALVSAFAGREFVLRAYEEAKKNDYRFYSFGDAMFIL